MKIKYLNILLIFALFSLVVNCKKRIVKQNSDKHSLQEIDTVFNSQGFVVVSKNDNEIKLIDKKDSLSIDGYHKIAFFNDTVVLAKNFEPDFTEVYKKMNFIYDFNRHRVSVFKGSLRRPDFSTNPEAKMFKTRIIEGCKDGINFAGHFTLIYWGCGTACQYGVVVDRKTGKIYDGYTSSMGSDYRADSRMIIFNGKINTSKQEFLRLDNYSQIQVKKWNGKVFKNLH